MMQKGKSQAWAWDKSYSYTYIKCAQKDSCPLKATKKFVVIGRLFAARRKEAKSPAGTNGDSGNFIC